MKTFTVSFKKDHPQTVTADELVYTSDVVKLVKVVDGEESIVAVYPLAVLQGVVANDAIETYDFDD